MVNLIRKLFGLAPSIDKSWAPSFMETEFGREYRGLKKIGINVTNEVAYDFLKSYGEFKNEQGR